MRTLVEKAKVIKMRRITEYPMKNRALLFCSLSWVVLYARR
jgi:hypothetical protein